MALYLFFWVCQVYCSTPQCRLLDGRSHARLSTVTGLAHGGVDGVPVVGSHPGDDILTAKEHGFVLKRFPMLSQ